MSFLRNQLRSVIQWDNTDPDVIFEHYDEKRGNEIKNNSTLIIQPGQGCLFVYEGKILGCLTDEGSYPLKTANIPFITTLLSFMNDFESKHKTALYFFKLTQFTDTNWGTISDIKYIDPVYKIPVGLKGFGNYTFSIGSPAAFFEKFIGGLPVFKITDVEEIVNNRLIEPLATILAHAGYSYIEIDKNRPTLSNNLKDELNKIMTPLGLKLEDFRIGGLSFDEPTMQNIQKLAEVITDVKAAEEAGISYTEMQKLSALREAAGNEGTAGAGASATVGLFMAQEMMRQAANTSDVSGVKPSPESRLEKLKQLFEKGLITEQEYQDRKQEILKEI